MERRYLGYLLALGAGLTGRWAGALTGSGAGGAAFVGGALYGHAPPGASVALTSFFVSSSALTRLPGARSARDAGGRTLGQVLANGGVAAAGALLYQARPGAPALALIGGSLAAATADTWATELGTRYGGHPRLITNLQQVPTGTDGGISAVGLAASLAGAGAVSVLYVLTLPVTNRRGLAASCAVGGVAGSLIDSLLGATLERSTPGRRAPLGNNAVNALNTLTGGMIAALLVRRVVPH